MPTMPLALLLALFAGCGSKTEDAGREKVIVLAAASTIDAIEEIAQAFEKQTQIEVELSAGPSNGLAQQIIAGAPADVFLSANKRWAEAIAQEGLADDSVDLLTNRIVLIVPQGNPANITQLNDLAAEGVTRVAIAGESVPAGAYAEQALRYVNLLESLQESNKLARGSDVRVTLTYVERAEAEAGLVYATDARISRQVEVIAEVDPKSYGAIVYPLVLLKAASQKTGPKQFYDFLQSPEAQSIFARFGFTTLASQP